MTEEKETQTEENASARPKPRFLWIVAIMVLMTMPLTIVAEAFLEEFLVWVQNAISGSLVAQDTEFSASREGQEFAKNLLRDRFPAVVGLPFAAALSLVLVIVLRSTSGPIEFEAFGLKFKGAAGPIIFWVITFLSVSAAIKMLW
jgi:hypothetical protein